MNSTAAPSPMPPAMFGVPASNLYGRSFQVDSSNDTVRIMSPPPWYGSASSSRSARP